MNDMSGSAAATATAAATPAEIPSSEGHEDFQAHLKTYWIIFGALLVGTALTVAVAYLDLGDTTAIVVALTIATAKASLVALWFMHLLDDRKVKAIGLTLIFTGIFFLGCILGPVLTVSDAVSMEVLQ